MAVRILLLRAAVALSFGMVVASAGYVDRDLENLPSCPVSLGDVEYYEISVEVKEQSANCNPKEQRDMGNVIVAAVDYVENNVRKYAEEVVNATMCPEPITLNGRALRLDDQSHRGLGLYSFYYGGGYCRRCPTDNTDRRLDIQAIKELYNIEDLFKLLERIISDIDDIKILLQDKKLDKDIRKQLEIDLEGLKKMQMDVENAIFAEELVVSETQTLGNSDNQSSGNTDFYKKMEEMIEIVVKDRLRNEIGCFGELDMTAPGVMATVNPVDTYPDLQC